MNDEQVATEDGLVDLNDHEQCKEAVITLRRQLTEAEDHNDILDQALINFKYTLDNWGETETIDSVEVTHNVERLNEIMNWCIEEIQAYVGIPEQKDG